MLLRRIALLLTCLAPVAAAQEPADLILTGGKIATLANGEGFVEALAVTDGHVHAVGSAEAVERHRGPDTRVVDLEGRTVIPGLNDSHAHVVRGGRFYNLELRWDGVPTLAEALERVRVQAERTPAGQWVRVIGAWSPYQFAEKRLPTIPELNAAAPDTPVFVLFLYSMAFVNRAGAEALGLTEDSVPPRGGYYRFVDGGAELVADPNPTILYKTIAALPHLEPAHPVNSTLHFYRELNRFGLTSAIDAGGGGHLFPVDYTATERLANTTGLPLRVSFFLFPQRPGSELEDFRDWTTKNALGTNGDRLRRNGYVLQGGGEFLAWAAGDFENFLAPRPSLDRMMDRQLQGVASLLAAKRWPFRIHATYGESIDRILDVFDRVDAEHDIGDLRWVIDHAETIRPDQIQRIQRMGGGIAVQNRMAFAGEYFVERYGAEAARTAPPLRALVDSGVPLAAGTDATRVSSHNPWLSLAWMVTGETVGRTVLYPPEERLTRLEALELYTAGGAWISGEEARKGRLTPGRFADLAVLDRDYFTCPDGEIRDIESVLTIVGGEPVYAAGAYAALVPDLPEALPAWSPVRPFPGYRASDQRAPDDDRTRPGSSPAKDRTGHAKETEPMLQEAATMLQIRRSDERGHADHGWLDTYHTFSFAEYFDPDHMQFGLLRVLNQDAVAPGMGFGTHGHKDMEIVSYVLDGVLEHKDSMGNGSQMRPGDVQLMSAGSGVTHSEFNGSEDEHLRFLQMWVFPKESGTKPRYEQKHFSADERRGLLRLVVSPDGAQGSVTIGQDARLFAGLFAASETDVVELSADRAAWLHVARGRVRVNGEELGPGDGAGFRGGGALAVEGLEDAEVVLWDLPGNGVE